MDYVTNNDWKEFKKSIRELGSEVQNVTTKIRTALTKSQEKLAKCNDKFTRLQTEKKAETPLKQQSGSTFYNPI